MTGIMNTTNTTDTTTQDALTSAKYWKVNYEELRETSDKLVQFAACRVMEADQHINDIDNGLHSARDPTQLDHERLEHLAEMRCWKHVIRHNYGYCTTELVKRIADGEL